VCVNAGVCNSWSPREQHAVAAHGGYMYDDDDRDDDDYDDNDDHIIAHILHASFIQVSDRWIRISSVYEV